MLKITKEYTEKELKKQLVLLHGKIIDISINEIIYPKIFRNIIKRISNYCKKYFIIIVNFEVNNSYFAGDMCVMTITELLAEHPTIETVHISEQTEADHCFSNADIFHLHSYLHLQKQNTVIILPDATELSQFNQIKKFSWHNPYTSIFTNRTEELQYRITYFPLEQQTANFTCFAAALRMVMKFYAPQYENFLKIPSERQFNKLFKTTATEGTDLDYAHECLIALGYFCQTGKLENIELSELLDKLLNLVRHGIPLMVNSIDKVGDGHISVIIDVTPEGRLVFADPGRRYDRDVRFYTRSKEKFLLTWKDSNDIMGRYFILYPNQEEFLNYSQFLLN